MHYDLIIVGNGILSYSIAFETAKRSPQLKIAIIGPQVKTGGATAAAGAMLNAFAEVTNTTFSSEAGKLKFEMSVQASKLWPRWIEEINDYLPFTKKLSRQEGTFVILNAKSGYLDDENYNSILKALHLYQEPYQETDPKDIPGINPTESARPLKSLFLPQEGSINSQNVVDALEYIITTCFNVHIIDDVVIKISTAADKIDCVETRHNGSFSSATIVLAAGAYSQSLIDQIPQIKNKIPPVMAGVGYSLLLRQQIASPIEHVIRTPNRSGACGLHALPRDANSLYVGATNNVHTTPLHSMNAGLAHFIIECAIDQLNQDFYKSEIVNWQVGNRPATLDTFPLLGATSISGLWILTGTYRDGFHQAPLIARDLSKEIMGAEKLLPDLFKPERSLIQTRTRQESIEEFLLHFMAGTYEHGAKLPKFLQDSAYLDMIRYKIERWYETLETSFNLSPDMLLAFHFDPFPHKRLLSFKKYFADSSVLEKVA